MDLLIAASQRIPDKEQIIEKVNQLSQIWANNGNPVIGNRLLPATFDHAWQPGTGFMRTQDAVANPVANTNLQDNQQFANTLVPAITNYGTPSVIPRSIAQVIAYDAMFNPIFANQAGGDYSYRIGDGQARVLPLIPTDITCNFNLSQLGYFYDIVGAAYPYSLHRSVPPQGGRTWQVDNTIWERQQVNNNAQITTVTATDAIILTADGAVYNFKSTLPFRITPATLYIRKNVKTGTVPYLCDFSGVEEQLYGFCTGVVTISAQSPVFQPNSVLSGPVYDIQSGDGYGFR